MRSDIKGCFDHITRNPPLTCPYCPDVFVAEALPVLPSANPPSVGDSLL
jgi:hypothetical protein